MKLEVGEVGTRHQKDEAGGQNVQKGVKSWTEVGTMTLATGQ